MEVRFKRISEPIRIGNMEVKNRIVMAPMGTNYADKDGGITERLVNYLKKRAMGGMGLMIVENTSIDLRARVLSQQPVIDDDKLIPEWRSLTQCIQKYGPKIAIQLSHGGRKAKASINNGIPPVGPSPIPAPGEEVPEELTGRDIKQIQCRFAEAAARAKAAGFDAVEIHAAHMYLIAQFLSSASNQRKDEYGGEVRNRARFLEEILRSTRESVGRGYPIICRINGREFWVKDGLTLREAREIAQIAQNAGADAIHVSAQTWGSHPNGLPPTAQVPGNLLFLVEEIKKVVSVPVIAVGKINLQIAEKALQEEKTDLVAIGRGFLSDPDFLTKIVSGREEEVRPCIGCLRCLNHLISYDEPLHCTVNPALGSEREYIIETTTKAKKVFVIGGGPAGMEAARLSKLRGHHVTLYEKNPRLGGQLLLAVKPPHKNVIEDLTRYLTTQVFKQGVKVELGKSVTPQLLEEEKPDVVILATGAIQILPAIPGIDKPNVAMAWDILAGKVHVGETVVIVGGNLVGCETAEFLVEKGKKVKIVEILPQIAHSLEPQIRELLLKRLVQKGVEMMTRINVMAVRDDGLDIKSHDQTEQRIQAETIVIAAGAVANRKLLNALQGKGVEIYPVGDCVEPGKIESAIKGGLTAALKI